MKKPFFFFMSFVVFFSHAAFAEISSEDFAYGAPIYTDQQNAIYAFSVPDIVYQKVTQADIGDVRIFNAQNETVPLTVRRQKSKALSSGESVSLPFFPLLISSVKGGEDLSFRFRTDQKGTILHMDARPSAKPAQKTFNTCIIDGSSLERTPEKLILEWEKKEKDFVSIVTVFSSENLETWTREKDTATITDLEFGGHNLKKNEISLSRNTGPYLKLSWPDAISRITLKKITAVLPGHITPADRVWKRLQPVQAFAEGQEFVYETGGKMPVDTIQVIMPQSNTMVRAEMLESRDQKTWTKIFQGDVYHLMIKNAPVTEDTFSVRPASRKYLKLRIISPSGGPGRKRPDINIGWIPHKIVFIAQGSGPFYLAFGTQDAPVEITAMNPLFDRLEEKYDTGFISEVSIGESYLLGGEEKLLPVKPPFPWKTWLLWSVLFAGVAMLGFMAHRLYRQMQQHDPE